MSLSSRIKEARLKCGLTQEQLANMVGVAKSTITGYEVGNREPTAAKVGEIADALNVDANFLYQDEVKMFYENRATSDEMEQIKKYRFISLHSPEGIKTVDYILDREYGVAEQIRKHNETLSDLQRQYSNQPAPLIELEQTAHARYAIPYYRRLASAGSGEYLFDNIPTETIEIPANSLSEKADFAIGVNGNSMEPTYCDGDKVYVRLADEIPMGRIGIFVRGNECFIKELGMDRLISHNKEHSDIPATEDIRLVGEVLGKVEED